jgi:DNA-binding transcriptional ArsR family regulator
MSKGVRDRRSASAAERNVQAFDVRWAKALSHPTRVEILQCLADQESMSPAGFAAARRIALGAANYHFRQLEHFGLVAVVSERRRRGSVEHFYALRPGTGVARAIRSGHHLPSHLPGSHTSGQAILDAAAIAELRALIADLFTEMRRLEADTVRRSAVESHASAFDVSVIYAVDGAARSDAPT